jgi:hypothetical protein
MHEFAQIKNTNRTDVGKISLAAVHAGDYFQ